MQNNHKWDKLRLNAASPKCTACNLCLVACVGAHGEGPAISAQMTDDNTLTLGSALVPGGFSTRTARLQIDIITPDKHKVRICTLCQKCIDICPTGALRWQAQSGALELLPERCTACGACVDICPTRVIVQSEEAIPWYPILCDLCGGDPACTRICPTEAIVLAERVKN